jgi:hypothetical protein
VVTGQLKSTEKQKREAGKTGNSLQLQPNWGGSGVEAEGG